MALDNARPRIDKLGVKPGHKVSVVGIDDAVFARELEARTDDVRYGRIAKGSDIIFLGVTRSRDLARLATALRAMARNGAVWVIRPKGVHGFDENAVRNAALAAGLVDVKVVSFSETLSALKLVIRLVDR